MLKKQKEIKHVTPDLLVKGKDDGGGEGSGERGAEKGLFSLLVIPKKFVPLLLNVLNYRPLQAVPRPFLGSRHYNKCIVCLRGGSTERHLNQLSLSSEPCNAERVLCGPWAPGGMKPMNGRRLCCVSPLESFVCPSKMTSSHMGHLQWAQPRELDRSGSTWACHMFGMNHLILYALSCELSEEEKSINASGIFSEQTRGLWKPFRSSSPWAALSVFLNGQLQRLQPSLHLALSCACQRSQN